MTYKQAMQADLLKMSHDELLQAVRSMEYEARRRQKSLRQTSNKKVKKVQEMFEESNKMFKEVGKIKTGKDTEKTIYKTVFSAKAISKDMTQRQLLTRARELNRFLSLKTSTVTGARETYDNILEASRRILKGNVTWDQAKELWKTIDEVKESEAYKKLVFESSVFSRYVHKAVTALGENASYEKIITKALKLREKDQEEDSIRHQRFEEATTPKKELW